VSNHDWLSLEGVKKDPRQFFRAIQHDLVATRQCNRVPTLGLRLFVERRKRGTLDEARSEDEGDIPDLLNVSRETDALLK
jgi:hypothetical protein